MSFLDDSVIPEWAWILVIAVASLLVLCISTWIVRCLVVRRRKKPSPVDIEGTEPPERRVTLRRGRLIPNSSYLSLTGSRFGLNHFLAEENGITSPSVRSKSPFEWWQSIKDRSVSRHSNRNSHISMSHQSYISYDNSSAAGAATHGFSRFNPSPGPSLHARNEKGLTATIVEDSVSDAPISPVSSTFLSPDTIRRPAVNFSRSFSSTSQRSTALYREPTLSRIEELTPRQSVFSLSTLRDRIRTSIISVYDDPSDDRPKVSPRLQALSETPTPYDTQTFYRSSTSQSHYRQSSVPNFSRKDSAVSHSRSTSSHTIVMHDDEKPYEVNEIRSPPRVAHRDRSPIDRGYDSDDYHQFTFEAYSAPPVSYMETSANGQTALPSYEEYASANPFVPVRSESHSRNVLRKKSITRTQAAAANMI